MIARLTPAWIEALRPTFDGTGSAGVPKIDDEPAWLRALSQEQRIEKAREHIAREVGETKGKSLPGTTFNVARSIARGFGIRDVEAVHKILMEYDAKCVPPWGSERMARHAWAALNTATSPEWGAHCRPAEVQLTDTLDDLGLPADEIADMVRVATATPEPTAKRERTAADPAFTERGEIEIPQIIYAPPAPPAHETAEPISRGALEADLRAAQRRLARSSNSQHVHDADLIKRALRGLPLADHVAERGEALGVALEAIARHGPAGAQPDHVAELFMASVPGSTPTELAAAFGVARQSARPVPRGRAVNEPVADDAPRPADDDEVRARLQPGPNGEGVRGSGPNIELILRHGSDTRDQVRFNMLTKVLEISGGPLMTFPPDVLDVAMKNYLGRKWNLHCSTSEVAEQIGMVSRTYWKYDPVVEYLREDIRWDGIPRIGGHDSVSWVTTYCGVTDTPYARKVGARFMISAVARALDPGCKVDTVLVLEGLQGAKKSQTLKALAGEWFTDTPINIGDKDSRMLAASTWIVELAELSSLSAGEVESHKAFLSSSTDQFRPPYGRTIVSYERRCVFAGSTNAEEYLRDPTGARRFWAVRVGACLPNELGRIRDQLWAEAVARFDSSSCAEWAAGDNYAKNPAAERWWFEPYEEGEAAAEIESRSVEDPWVPLIMQWIDTESRPGAGAGTGSHAFTLAEIAEGALHMAPADMPRHQAKIASAMRAAGLSSRRAAGGKRHRIWFRPPPGEAPTHHGEPVENERKNVGAN